MLLEGSLIIINIFLKNIYLLLILFLILLFLNFKNDKNFIKQIKRIAKFSLIYLFYLLVGICFYKNGKVLFKIYSIYITEEGLLNGFITYIKLVNLLLLSFFISVKFKEKKYNLDIKNKKIQKIEMFYSEVFEKILETVPFIFDLIKKRSKFSDIYKRILIKVYKNL